MNKTIKLAVAGAVFAAASVANAGIIIPAGEWTLDVNGNVNAFANYTHARSGQLGTGSVDTTGLDQGETVTSDYNTASAISGGLAWGGAAAGSKYQNRTSGINTGLLPAWLGFTGTTRQNDLDVAFTVSMQPNVSDNGATGDANAPLFRQAFLSFGDKSWGSVKLGKDIGVFASDAILNDMTLLGVGAGSAGIYGNAGGSGAATTLGGIGTGYIYAAWKGQVAYTTPNFSGFQATVAITNPNQQPNAVGNQDRFGLEGKASYEMKQDGFSGKVWVSGASYDVNLGTATYSVSAGDIGARVETGPFSLVGYYYGGKGAGTTFLGANGTATTYTYTAIETPAGVDAVARTANVSTDRRDSDGGYIQLQYTTPFKTRLGAAYGISNLDLASSETAVNNNTVKSNERWTIAAYHPLTKHLNLVAEYNNVQSEAHDGTKVENDTYSAGAILFF